MIWEPEKIEALVQEALTHGESKIVLGSPRDAKLFRNAIYNRFYMGESRPPLLVSISDRTVSIRKR